MIILITHRDELTTAFTQVIEEDELFASFASVDETERKLAQNKPPRIEAVLLDLSCDSKAVDALLKAAGSAKTLTKARLCPIIPNDHSVKDINKCYHLGVETFFYEPVSPKDVVQTLRSTSPSRT